MINRVFNCKNV